MDNGLSYFIPHHGRAKISLRVPDILQEISATYAAVSFTVTCADDALSVRTEPGAPASSPEDQREPLPLPVIPHSSSFLLFSPLLLPASFRQTDLLL